MMCEHEFESLRTADGYFCMTACRLCMKSTGEIETLFKAENRITAANARIAELAIALEKLQVCAICRQYNPTDEWGNDKECACKANKKLENRPFDKCSSWKIARWLE